MSSDRTTRKNFLRFGHGTATIQVDHWLSDPQGEQPSTDEVTCSVDHLMGSVVQDTFKVMGQLNRSVQAKGLDEGDVVHTSTRSMTIGGATMRVKVSLHVFRNVPSYILATDVDEVLKGAVPCMIHLLDNSLQDEDVLSSLPPFLRGLLGDLPDGVRVMGFPSDLFGGMPGDGSRGHQAHGYAGGTPGQYL